MTTVPAWFLLPGLGGFVASLATYVQYQRTFPASGLDLGIYRQAVEAFLAGRPVYDLTFTLNLPYTYPPIMLPLLAPLAGPDEAGALHILTALSIVATFLTVWFSVGLMGYRGAQADSGWLAPLPDSRCGSSR
jgi:hypothetical protein